MKRFWIKLKIKKLERKIGESVGDFVCKYCDHCLFDHGNIYDELGCPGHSDTSRGFDFKKFVK